MISRVSKLRCAPLLAACLALGTACGNSGSHDTSDANNAQAGGDGGSVGRADGGGNADGSAAGGQGDGGPGVTPGGDGGATTMLPFVPGEVDPGSPENTGLPPVPRLVNVRASAVGDSVSIAFDPIDGAADYRVYELPAASDVTADGNGHVTINNAVYRCAGNRQAPAATLDGAEQVASGAIHTLVDGQSVGGYKRSLADATLGYVYAEPRDGLIPVYALGDHDAKADNECYFQRWTASRLKQYVTSSSVRADLLSKGFRDDGIAFYVPAVASGSTRQIFTSVSTEDDGARYYFADGAESKARKGATAAFFASSVQDTGAVPLMRVFYANACGASHDELVAGKARFEVARRQGDTLPLTKLHWSGLTGPTTLVVEALDQGCPFQGLIAPKAGKGYVDSFLGVTYQPWITPSQVQASSAGHELFINGQFDGTKPRPIARSFIKITPAAAPALDWSFGFTANDSLGKFVDTDCGALDGNCYSQYRYKTPSVDAEFFNVQDDRYTHMQMFGEWWVMYADLSADTNGKYRLTPNTKADMAGDSFLYVCMEVDSFTTGRRYPQILISDRDVPVQVRLAQGNTLVIQTFADWPNTYELQICDHKSWDVNDQCPRFDMYYQRDPKNAATVTGLMPNVEVGDQVGIDQSNRFEVYVSTKRAYMFLDGQPYGCADLPSAGVPKGPVTVTYGDVLYHSDADGLFDFTTRHLHNDTLRHFDNLGFKSHVSAPPWDESRYPCTPHLMDNN